MNTEQSVQIGVWAVDRDNLTREISQKRTELAVVNAELKEKVKSKEPLAIELAILKANIEEAKREKARLNETVSKDLADKLVALSSTDSLLVEKNKQLNKINTEISNKTLNLESLNRAVDKMTASFNSLSDNLSSVIQKIREISQVSESNISTVARDITKIFTKVTAELQVIATNKAKLEVRNNSIKAREAAIAEFNSHK